MLEIKALTKKYGDFLALDNVGFDIAENELISILGPNGAGKSTLIKCIVGFQKQSSGSITYNGKAWNTAVRTRYVGWAPQEDSFYPNLSVKENLVFFGSLYDMSYDQTIIRANNLLELLKLKEKLNTKAKALSGGMKKRLNMAIALIHSPKVLILDEPEAGVDPISRISLWDAIKEIRKQGTSILLCTHNLVETEHLAKRVMIMKKGRLIYFGSADNLKKKYKGTLEDGFKKIVGED